MRLNPFCRQTPVESWTDHAENPDQRLIADSVRAAILASRDVVPITDMEMAEHRLIERGVQTTMTVRDICLGIAVGYNDAVDDLVRAGKVRADPR